MCSLGAFVLVGEADNKQGRISHIVPDSDTQRPHRVRGHE